MTADEKVIEETRNWLKKVVIDLNFCPFAAKPFLTKRIHYQVENSIDMADALELIIQECDRLNSTPDIETSLLIFPKAYTNFYDYLALVDSAEELLIDEGYEGVYQVASFHPQYCFEGMDESAASNFTNRSIYPMLHLIREASLSNALESFKDAHLIPNKNIQTCNEKGIAYMQSLRNSCII